MGPKPTIGRIVHYHMPNGEFRPATITQVFESEGYQGGYGCNLTIWLDQANDERHTEALKQQGCFSKDGGASAYATSSVQGGKPGNWAWPPRS